MVRLGRTQTLMRERRRIGELQMLLYLSSADKQGAHPTPSHQEKNMAKAQNAAPIKTASKGSAASAHKPIKEALNKTGLVTYLVDVSGVPAKDVRAVLAALEGAVAGSVHKKGAGSFTLPGLLKISAVQVAAKPRRKGVNPFTKEEQWFAAKPASTKIKVRPLKKLKDAAA